MPCDIIKKSEPIFKNSRQITRDMNQFHGIFCFDEHSIQFFFLFLARHWAAWRGFWTWFHQWQWWQYSLGELTIRRNCAVYWLIKKKAFIISDGFGIPEKNRFLKWHVLYMVFMASWTRLLFSFFGIIKIIWKIIKKFGAKYEENFCSRLASFKKPIFRLNSRYPKIHSRVTKSMSLFTIYLKNHNFFCAKFSVLRMMSMKNRNMT